MMVTARFLPGFMVLLLAGCASQPVPVATIAPPAEPARTAAPRPAGAADNLQLPARLADGSFATPNRNLSAAAALWHLRTGLNVAALSCRGPDEAALLAGYARFLAAYRAPLATAQHTLADSLGTAGGFDREMTRLYNYWALPPAQAGFCAAATRVIAQAASVEAVALPGFAPQAVAELDRPFTDFYAAYAAWREGGTSTFAVAAPVAIGPAPQIALAYDPAVFRMP